MTKFLKKTRELFSCVDKEKNNVIKHLAGIEDEINTAADKRIAVIQRDKGKLLLVDKLIAAIEHDRVELLSEVQSIVMALESSKRYSETLLSSGTAGDVTRSTNSLHDTTDKV